MIDEIVQFIVKYFGSDGIKSLKKAIKDYEDTKDKLQERTKIEKETGKGSR
jgi:hypothetical protein